MNCALFRRALIAAVLTATPMSAAPSDDTNTEIRLLREELTRLRNKVEKLEEEVGQQRLAQSEAKLETPSLPENARGYFDFSLIGSFAAGASTGDPGELQIGGHDPNQRGFTLQSVELVMSGSVDPYFDALAVLLFGIDSEGESFLEIEEAWMESTSLLPWNLKIRGGQLLTAFGRFNTTHLHQWAFVDSPLVNARLLGADGLRGPGAQVSWIAPTPFYSELTLGVQNAQQEHEHAHGGESLLEETGGTSRLEDLMFSARYAASFDLTSNQTLLGGISGAIGKNEFGRNHHTSILGADLFWKWKPSWQSGGYPFVSWQTEAMLRNSEVAFDSHAEAEEDEHEAEEEHEAHGSSDTLHDWGFYSQLSWGFTRGWVAAFRVDYVEGEDLLETQSRWRFSPNLTWFPSEFSKLRLQYNYDHGEESRGDHSVWLQWEFSLGPHGAHTF